MKIGCCINHKDWDHLKIGKDAGLDFVELSLSSLSESSTENIRELSDYLKEISLPSPCANCFFTDRVRLVGPNLDFVLIDEYLNETLEKIVPLNIRHIVLGSGGARRIPDGFSPEEANEQILRVCKEHIAPLMEKYDIICGLEELNRQQTNLLNTCKEAVEMMRVLNHPRFRLLVDNYHMALENEPYESLLAYKGLISHVHISHMDASRRFPKQERLDEYRAFRQILLDAGYPEDGMFSIEGHVKAGETFTLAVTEAMSVLNCCVR